MPDRLAPKTGQQQQAPLPQYPHPALAALFAAKVASSSNSSSAAPAGHAGSGLAGPPAASIGSSGSLGAAVSADSGSMARVGSGGGGSSGLSSKNVTSLQATQQQTGRKVRASDPTDSMTRSELFAGSPSPRTASGSGEAGSRPGSGSAGSGASRGALSPAAAAAPPGATVSGLVGPSGTPRVRTAEEIRQAYGRPQLSKAQVGFGVHALACFTAGALSPCVAQTYVSTPALTGL